MDSARDTHDPAAEEAACLHVLELLPADERRGFEQRLASEPPLRELVRELQGNLDALALAEPERPAPLHVWGRIAAQVKAEEADVLGFPAWARAWVPRLLAAAACLAFGAWLHAWFVSSPKAVPTVAHALATAVPLPVSATTQVVAMPIARPNHVAPVPVPSQPTNAVALAEAARLREHVRVLAAQVEALNQVLTQQVALPSGVTRLHVFQLVTTNGTGDLQPQARPWSLPEALAQLAANQHAGVADADDTQPEPTGATPASLVADAANFGPGSTNAVASVAGLPLNDGQPIGFFDPDTGRGAIALLNGNQTADQDFVVWSQTIGADGSQIFQNLGAKSAGDPTVVISFNAPANSSPSFFVTLEASDNAAMATAPSGPVVALPPPSKP